MNKIPLRFIYLNLKDHPRGNYMLQHLISNGFIPELIIEEESRLSKQSYSALIKELEKVKNISLPPLTETLLNNYQLKVIHVDHHNDALTETAIRMHKPDIIVLGDTRIIKKHLIDLSPMGIINVHPGYLPDVRGNNPYIWSIFHELPFGCSVHYIDENIDTGDLILRRKIDLQNSTSYETMLVKINECCADLIVETLNQIQEGVFNRIPQNTIKVENNSFPTFTKAPKDIKHKVRKMLESKLRIYQI